jgi:AraC-like DNA-binding protein
VHILRTARPSPALQKYVRVYAQRELDQNGLPFFEPVSARLEPVLQFQFGDLLEVRYPNGSIQTAPRIVVLGSRTHPGLELQLAGKVRSFGVFFQPAGYSELFRTPMNKIRDQSYEAISVLGGSALQLWNQLGEVLTFAERVQIIERFLIQYAVRVLVPKIVSDVADHLLAVGGVTRIAELADNAGLGLRQFERRFFDEVGTGPKLYARIARFQTALDTKIARPEWTWTDIAHDLGYHDQMHMVRDFRKLSGDSPGHLISQIGDMRPPALLVRSRSLCGTLVELKQST